ncbi:PE domain-containing protein [Williamsia deligens]|uniref:PE domain-containing protein n=1 Tax=Williamsia deligens TaxID=321325 RepID=A0ABW3G9E4_9NOCA|nr:PE domain-containing protein [Williamsia deligens]MCP2192970.1 PE family protein [Williamsia deligens]
MSDIAVDPAHLRKAVSRLEAIAAELERTVATHGDDLRTAPAGSDEVSRAASASFTASADSFDAEIVKGVAGIRDVAAALRDGSATIATTDATVASELSGL